jgi:hypothetical protein
VQSTEICQLAKDAKHRYQTIGEVFFSFYQKFYDTKPIYQTLGDAGAEKHGVTNNAYMEN